MGIFTSSEVAEFFRETGITHKLCSAENLTSDRCSERHVGLARGDGEEGMQGRALRV